MQMLCNPQYKKKASVNICSVIQITKISVCKFEHLQQCPDMIFYVSGFRHVFLLQFFLKPIKCFQVLLLIRYNVAFCLSSLWRLNEVT